MAVWHSIVALMLVAGAQGSTTAPGKMIERVACPSDPTQTYTLYLPTTYDAGKQWPLLLVFDPRGRGTAAATVFRDAAEVHGWIVVSSDNTRSDGSWEPNGRALAALWPHVLRAYSVDRRRVYAAGFSGGATVAWVLARTSEGIAGIIAAGARAPEDASQTPGRVAWFGAAGRADFNFLQARILDDRMARAGNPHRVEFFDGMHQWMTPDVALSAVRWLEMLAMKEGLRPRDTTLAARAVANEMTRAAQLEAEGRLVDARRALASIVESYGALADVSAAARRGEELDADARSGRARKAEERSDDREHARRAESAQVLARSFRADEPPFPRELIGLLKIPALQKSARRTDYDGESARRVLEFIFVQTSFYLPEEFEQKRDFTRAALALDIAAAIHPDRPFVWVNLAGARAMAGSKKSALDALEKAVEAGFRDRSALAADERFESLRGTPEYARLVQLIDGK